jgi:hypothetical protein
MRNEGRELLIDYDCKADRLDELADTIYRAMIGARPPFKPDPAQSADTPIDMVLFCPACGTQHIDAPDSKTDWTNPPHRSHLCHRCKYVWRPADIATNGVANILTHGSADTASRPQSARGEVSEAEVKAAALAIAKRRFGVNVAWPENNEEARVALEAAARVRGGE